jgi:hypothetical protein
VYNFTLSLISKPQQMKPKPEMYDIKGWQLAAIFFVILFLTQQLEKL